MSMCWAPCVQAINTRFSGQTMYCMAKRFPGELNACTWRLQDLSHSEFKICLLSSNRRHMSPNALQPHQNSSIVPVGSISSYYWESRCSSRVIWILSEVCVQHLIPSRTHAVSWALKTPPLPARQLQIKRIITVLNKGNFCLSARDQLSGSKLFINLVAESQLQIRVPVKE